MTVTAPSVLAEFIAELGIVRDPTLRDRADDDATYRELLDLPRYEWLTDTVIASTFRVHDGETYSDAGRRLTELGKKLCQIPRAETAFLCVVGAETDNRMGRIDLPLTSFLDLHSSDPTDRMMAEQIWEGNAPMMVKRVFEPW